MIQWKYKKLDNCGRIDMLGKLELKIKAQEKLGYQMSSLFHGALMELLPADYADYMHVSQLHPYTQHLEYREGEWYWVICCLNKEAVKIIIQDTLWNITSIKIKNRDLTVQITQKNYSEIAYQELMNHFYEKDYSPFIQIHFLTPTAFKKQGKYLFYPDIRCIFQSLMNKYDSAARNEKMVDMDTLEQLTENAQIVRYDLKSVSFSLEGVKIPAFLGEVVVKMNGTRTISNFANMLFEFGEYSGVGIKTALGMGCMKILNEGRKKW